MRNVVSVRTVLLSLIKLSILFPISTLPQILGACVKYEGDDFILFSKAPHQIVRDKVPLKMEIMIKLLQLVAITSLCGTAFHKGIIMHCLTLRLHFQYAPLPETDS